MPLSADKIEMVAKVFAMAPCEVVRRLEGLLGAARAGDPSLVPVHAVAAEEARLRRIMAAVFAPLLPLTRPRRPAEPLLAARQLREAWLSLCEAAPDLAEAASRAALGKPKPKPGEAARAYDLACARAAELVSDPRLGRLLRVAHLLRFVQSHLVGWLKAPDGDNGAAMRLAFKDALDLDEAIGPLFWDAVMGLLDEPWQVLRLISATADRPSDRYMAASELSFVGERILGDIDRRLGLLREFDAGGGAKVGAAAADSLGVAVREIAEFGQWIALETDGPWGTRVLLQKTDAAELMEGRLMAVEAAVGRALPTRHAGANKHVRPRPLLAAAPEPRLQAQAEAYLTLLHDSRAAANAAGFAVIRNRALEAAEARIEQYCEDLVDLLRRGDDPNPERVRAYLALGAGLYERLKGDGAGQAFHRRAAA